MTPAPKVERTFAEPRHLVFHAGLDHNRRNGSGLLALASILDGTTRMPKPLGARWEDRGRLSRKRTYRAARPLARMSLNLP